MIDAIKSAVRKSKSLLVLYYLYDDWRTARNFRSGRISSVSGSTHDSLDIAKSVEYIETVFNDYITYSGVSTEWIAGKRILEIGPGDNLGVALEFLSRGAEKVVCVDKFFSRRDEKKEREIYAALGGGKSGEQKKNFDEAINIGDRAGEKACIIFNDEKLKVIYGKGAEEADSLSDEAPFDMIVSRAVFEHLADPQQAFRAMDKMLKPGGKMVHKVDMRDHDMFPARDFHPLTFLAIPESIYRRMTQNSGRPNRKLIDYYRKALNDLNYNSTIHIAHVVGADSEIIPHKIKIEKDIDYTAGNIELVEKIRPQLDAQFKALPTEDLLADAIFFTATKPDDRLKK